MKIVLCYPVEPKHLEWISAAAPGAEVVNAGQERIAEEIVSADVYCGHAKRPISWREVVDAGRLRWIQSSAAGVDHCLSPEIIESDVLVTSASGVLANQVAEHALALTGALCRGFPTFWEAQRKKEFIRRPTRDLHGSTAGIIGFGGVGRRIAELLSAYGVRILATDYFPVDQPDHVESLWPADQLGPLLAASDLVFLAAPLTAETRGMINAEALSLMKPDAFLMNVARGPLVVEADLVAALRSGTLAGAALDVTEQEPLPESSLLWDLPNVIITPHVAGQSARRIDDMTRFFCDNLHRDRQRENLRNVVDKQLGFAPPHPLPITAHRTAQVFNQKNF
ncbi:MAG: D-2-hydroxyacid dehydrogenase [Planctomycetales bacterium]